MNKNELEKFLLKAKTKIYAAAGGKAESTLPRSVQYGYSNIVKLHDNLYLSHDILAKSLPKKAF